MKTFKNLEQTVQDQPVRLVGQRGVHGWIRLDRGNTELRLMGPERFRLPDDTESGWYSVRVRLADRTEMLVHNAFTFQETSYPLGRRVGVSKGIYPNVVVDNVRGLAAGNRVEAIHLQLDGLVHFFNYPFTESLRASELTEPQRDMLATLRYPGHEGVFKLDQLFAVHHYPEFFSFRVNDRTYSAWAGSRTSGGKLDRLRTKVTPTLTIRFDQPVPIDAALEFAWDWRRFFAQLAFAPIGFHGIALSAGRGRQTRSANVYMPNVRRKDRISGGRRPHMLQYYLPLNLWSERQQLADVMRRWLERSEEREAMRGRLGNVLAEQDRRTDLTHITSLCSAIDSLDELSDREPAPAGAIAAMAAAAVEAGQACAFMVDEERVRAVLGQLQRPSLARKIEILCARLTPPVPEAQRIALSKAVGTMRNDSVHGGVVAAQARARIGSVTQCLSGLLTRYDLETSGLPVVLPRQKRPPAFARFEEAIADLV